MKDIIFSKNTVTENKIKIYKTKGIVKKIEINGNTMYGVKSIKIKNDYASSTSDESIVIELTNISLLEIVSN